MTALVLLVNVMLVGMFVPSERRLFSWLQETAAAAVTAGWVDAAVELSAEIAAVSDL